YHMNQHNGLKPYVCSYEGCGKQYSNKVTRDRHEILVHCEDNYKHTCDQCGEKFKYRSSYNYHFAVKHQSQMVPCPICGKLLKHKSLIKVHVRRHGGHFPCPVCGKVLQKKYSLDVHMRTHTKEKPYSCELCSQRFMLKVQLKTHLSKVHELTWEQYAATYASQEENHRLLHEVSGTTPKRRFTWKTYFEDDGCIKIRKGGTIRYEKICELCGKQVERSMFEYHMNQHNGVRPYACSYEGCGKQYSNKITRDRHELLIHCQDNYKYECDRCGEKFKTRSTFDYHYAVRHQSQMVPCPICGKLLKHKSLIREHVKRHTVQFPCTVCGKVLQKKYSLDVHMRTHTNEKPYSCELCSQRFMLKVQLKTH
ncbi:AAEL002930-PA, partial [Aedes aegypti]